VDGLVTATGDGGCLIATHFDSADDAIEQLYGPALIGDQTALEGCQKTLGKAGAKYIGGTLKALQKCKDSFYKGKALYKDAAKTEQIFDSNACSEEYKTARKIAKTGLKARKLVAGARCSDALTAGLGACASTVDGLVDAGGEAGCLILGHAQEAFSMLRAEYCDDAICP
jgi:hypothetical protein